MSTPVLIGGRAFVAAPLTALRHHYAAAVLRQAGVFEALDKLPKDTPHLEVGSLILDRLALTGSIGKLLAALVEERLPEGEERPPFTPERAEALAAFFDARESPHDHTLLTALASSCAAAFFRNTPPSSATSAESSRPAGAPGVASGR